MRTARALIPLNQATYYHFLHAGSINICIEYVYIELKTQFLLLSANGWGLLSLMETLLTQIFSHFFLNYGPGAEYNVVVCGRLQL